MATTTHYNWPIPVATDYVKDGWDAIADLGNAIDTTVYGLGSSGMTLISSSTLTASSGAQINNVFSSTYDQYFVTWTGTGSANNVAIWLRLSVGGTPNTSSNYYYGGTYVTGTSGPSRDFPAAGTKALVGSVGDYSSNSFIYINNPFLTVPTNGNYQAAGWGSTANFAGAYSFAHNVSTSYDGIYFYPDSGTLTGTLRFYGLKK